MANSDSGKYLYNIERLKFRNKAAITLPKSGDSATLNRETCYKIAVDIVIESITKPEFRNFKTTPYHGFYGYATLVMRDCIAPKIQLQFGRNRIFEQRIVEAFDGWNSLAFYLQTTKRFLELLANTLRVGSPPSYLVNLCDIDAFSVAWSEIDLREIYVNCTENTQFRIELSWVSPEKFTDDCGKEQDGKSKEPDDPVKDRGLPPNGTQPRKNDPATPWNNNTPVPPLSPDNPYRNDKDSLLNNPNPDDSTEENPATQTTEGWYWRIVWETSSGSNVCEPMTATYIKSAPRTANFRIDSASPNNSPCAGYFNTYWAIFDPVTNSIIKTRYAYASGGNVSGARVFGLLPVADDNFLP